MRRKKVLVTGANGFAGQHLVSCLAQEYEVVGITSPRSSLLSQAGITYLSADITDSKTIKAIVSDHRPDFIVHLAAQTTGWFQNPTQLFEINLMSTINLYESIATLKNDDGYDPRILYVSSSEVYGKTTNPHFIEEGAPFFPVNHYASSKAAADRVSYSYTQSHDLNILILRAFTHTGPGTKRGSFVSDMASQIVRLEKSPHDNEIRVGNLDAIRDYSDVRDVVHAYRLVLKADLPRGTALNVCSGTGVKVRDILDTMIKLAKKEIIVKPDPDRIRPSDVPVFIGDNSKLVQATGWKQSIEISDTLREALRYYRKNVKV